MDILTAIGGMGRGLVERLPDEPVFPPIAPLEPFYGAGKAPQPSVRDIGEFLVPQSALDVGLMTVPGGRAGRPIARRAVEYGEAKLVPALREISTGKEYVGKLGTDIWHEGLAKRLGLEASRLKGKFEQGFTNSETGEWLDFAKAAKSAEAGMVTRSTRPNITSIPKERQLEDTLTAKAAATTRKHTPTEFSDNIVPALIDKNTGKIYPGKLGEDRFHSDVHRRMMIDVNPHNMDLRPGFVDAKGGKWLEPQAATKLSQERAKQFLTKEQKKRASEADRLAARSAAKTAKLKPFTGPTGEVFPPGIIDPGFPAPAWWASMP